jgi:aryl-alcohol dehydrogenase-like predicted oxidoreductase
MERRTFMKAVVATGVAGAAPSQAAEPLPQGAAASYGEGLLRGSDLGEKRGEMLYRKLGTTGETVSAIGMGGSHIGKPALSEAESIKLMHAAIDRGVTFMDNCWDYNQGESELRMGKALAQGGYRAKVFLMTKLDGRDKETATSQLDESLKRLQTDHVDLIQFHEIIRFEDPDRVFGEGGAIEAIMAAKKAGKVRHVGFTGHKDPHVHLYMFDLAQRHGFHFDTVQMPINVMDAHYRSFGKMVVPRALQAGTGVLGMKSLGDGVILKSGVVTAPECLRFSLSLPTSVVITGIDDQRSLDQAFAATRDFKPYSDAEMTALLARTADKAAQGEYELFKTSAYFDSTAKHPDYLGGMTEKVKSLAPIGNG